MILFLTQQERQHRKALCDVCEHNTGKKCALCGCFLIALQKVKYWNCPLDKWATEDLTSKEAIN